jgi:hypothetical protein
MASELLAVETIAETEIDPAPPGVSLGGGGLQPAQLLPQH